MKRCPKMRALQKLAITTFHGTTHISEDEIDIEATIKLLKV